MVKCSRKLKKLKINKFKYHYYTPYRKENSSTRYINFNSNQRTIIKKNLQKMIEKRLNRLSTDSQIFDNAKHNYQAALGQSNFNHKLKYENKNKTNYVCKKKEIKQEKSCCLTLHTSSQLKQILERNSYI